MSQRRIKSAKKHTVKEVFRSVQWDVADGSIRIISDLDDPENPVFVSISLEAITKAHNV